MTAGKVFGAIRSRSPAKSKRQACSHPGCTRFRPPAESRGRAYQDPGGSLDDEFDPSVLRARFVGGLFDQRLVWTVALSAQPGRADSLVHQVTPDRFRTRLAQAHIHVA